jgi:hypothetical protein
MSRKPQPDRRLKDFRARFMLKPMLSEKTQQAGHWPARARLARIALGIASLAIYIALSLLQNQNDDSTYLALGIERPAMASAVSHIAYGAPLASVYAGLFSAFIRPTGSLDAILEKAKKKEIEPYYLIPYTPDGLGAGESIFATVAMSVFGKHVSSILWSFLALMTVAVVAFLLRFSDNRALIAVAGLSALILMFASPLGTTTAGIAGFPVGGYRYFSLLAAIPAMHTFLELISNEQNILARQAIAHWLLLFVQLAIFAITFYVNIASVYLYGLLVFGIAYVLYRSRKDQFAQAARLLKVIVIVGVLGATLIAPKLLVPQAYKDTGRNGDMIWGRVFIALGVNPHWPFGTLADEYKGCWPEAPERTLGPGIRDFNLQCVWRKYAEVEHHMSSREMSDHMFDKDFNSVLLDTFVKIVRQYPVETLLTFVYYKPLAVRNSLLSLFDFTSPMLGWAALLVAVQFLILFAFALVEAQSIRRIGTVCISLVLGGLSTCGLYIVAWSNDVNTGDLFFYLLALLGVGITALLAAGVRLLLYSGQKVSNTLYVGTNAM